MQGLSIICGMIVIGIYRLFRINDQYCDPVSRTYYINEIFIESNPQKAWIAHNDQLVLWNGQTNIRKSIQCND